MVAFIPVASYAIVDINAYGGYAFGSNVELADSIVNPEPTGFEWGFSSHLNFDVLVFFKLGLGAYYQMSNLKTTDDYDYTKNNVGLDLNAQLNIPLIPIKPYAIFRTAIWENVGGDVIESTEYFKNFAFGGGVLFTILPIPKVLKLQLFADYLYHTGKQSDLKATGHSAHFGVRLDI